MLDFLPLAIFPTSSLAGSIIPVVWVGIFVVCFFNLRLGWALSGLVIPGYVVPLMLIKPWSAGVIFFESFLTYFLVWWFSEHASRKAPWSNLFGRDRFFALVLCSIFIRLLFDGWLLPLFGEWLNQTLEVNFDYQNHLHSFGLIVVALIANQFWKTGFVKGIVPFTTVIILTLLIVRYGLMEFTNFGLSNISYLYEDMASSILATPKAYIILISTAFLASRMNLYYGWDFNGILIPSLMALQWYQPIKIVATIAETSVILILAQYLLKTPWLSKMTIEGARKLLLFFNVSFAYKFILGYALVAFLPEVKVTDYFGFGYLLSTLMAVKIHDKAILARLTRATLQTSLASVVLASIIGYALTKLPVSELLRESNNEDRIQINEIKHLDDELPIIIKQEEVKLYQAKVNNSFTLPLARDNEAFTHAINLIEHYLNNPDPKTLQQAAAYLGQVNYALDIVKNRYLFIHEKDPVIGWGIYLFDMQHSTSLALSMPAPLDVRGILDAGVSLFQTLEARSLAISGSSRRVIASKNANVLQNQQTFFHQFHRLVNRHDSLQIRGYDALLARQIAGSRYSESEFELSGINTMIWAQKNLPPSLNLVKLKQLLDSFKINWNTPPYQNQQRITSGHGFAELLLTQQSIRQLLFKPFLINQKVDYVEQNKSIEGYLQEWILESKDLIAPKGSELYQVPQQDELLFLDEQVISPLLKLVSSYSKTVGWTVDNQDDLKQISISAEAMGYQIIHYKNKNTGQPFLILTEYDKETMRYWGTYVFRLGPAENFLVQIPRPLYEINSFEFGISLFERLQAKVLMIGMTHPNANQDGSSDLIAPSNVINLFNLINQVTLRDSSTAEMLAVSSRAFSYRADQPVVNADIMLSLAQGIVDPQHLKHLENKLLNTLAEDNLSIQWVDGSESTRGYEISGSSSTQYLKATKNKNFATLWLSPIAREGYRQQDKNTWELAKFNSLDINTQELNLASYIDKHGFTAHFENLKTFQNLLFEYLDNPDILRIQQLVMLPEARQYRFMRLIDSSSKQAFLVIQNRQGKLLAIANLHPRGRTVKSLDINSNLKQQALQFIENRNAWLQPGVS